MIPSGRIAEIRQESRSGDVSYRDVEWLCRIAEAADRFHEAFWNPWRSGRNVAMTSNAVAEAYGELRYALSHEPVAATAAESQQTEERGASG